MSTTRMPASAPLMGRSSIWSQGKDLLEKRLHVLGRLLAPFAVAADHRASLLAAPRVADHRARDVFAAGPDRDGEPIQVDLHAAVATGDDVLGANRRPDRVEVVIRVLVDDHVHVDALRFEPLTVLPARRGR